ncbi:FKBP-type peptidyl-prolyl cis-trans isomerase [Candidatus Woesearchaeota archaeon]|nr:FKBP-type peptidyl-prolyl cis-trans isomerase [Candidatus Woesearchaeota archaeon]
MVVKKSSFKRTDVKKRNKLIPIVVGVIILVLLLILLILQLNKVKAAEGDTVTVDYTGYLDDGTVFDTNIESIGLKSNLNREDYSPYTFVIGNGDVIPGFESQLIGLSSGEKKKFTLAPEMAYGNAKEEKIAHGLKRNLNITKYSFVNTSSYTVLFDKEPKIGDILRREEIPWNMKVVEINNTNIKIQNLLSLGDNINLTGVTWDSVIIGDDDEFITVRQNPKINDRVVFPSAAGILFAKVISVDENTFAIDSNHPLAGKSLTFEVEVKNIVKTK